MMERQKQRGKAGSTGVVAGRFTMCQVKRHNTADNLWLVAHGKVYDATELLDMHPGGRNSLLMEAGKDCTTDYDFHSKAARKIWGELCIGKVVPCRSEGDSGRCVIM